jgi:hypothetical protein
VDRRVSTRGRPAQYGMVRARSQRTPTLAAAPERAHGSGVAEDSASSYITAIVRGHGLRAKHGMGGMASVWTRAKIAGPLCALWLVASSVAGQAKQTDSAEYQQLVQQGLREYGLGNFSEAKAFFAQAHALSPNARTLRGLGMSSYELRHYVEASGYFEQALDSAERPLTLQMRGEVSQLLRQARSFMTHVKVTLEPSTAELRVDTRPGVTDANGQLLLDPGTHELVAEAPNHEPVSRSIRTDGGEQLTLRLSLHAQNDNKSDAPVAAETAAPSPSTASTTHHNDGSVGPWVLIGVSAAVAITGGVLLGLSAKDKSSVENPSHPDGMAPRWSDSLSAAQDRVLPLSIAGFAALGVGVAGLAAGVIWKVSSGGGGTESASAQLEVSPSGLRVKGHF